MQLFRSRRNTGFKILSATAIALLGSGRLTAVAADELAATRSTAAASDHAVVQSLLRISAGDAKKIPDRRESVVRYLRGIAKQSPGRMVDIAGQLHVDNIDDLLLDTVTDPAAGDAAVKAARLLIETGSIETLKTVLDTDDAESLLRMINVISAVDSGPASELVVGYLTDENRDPQIRSGTALALGKNWHGEQELLKLARAGAIPEPAKFEISNALLGSWTKEIVAEAKTLPSLQMVTSKSQNALPPINQLMQQDGDLARGKEIYFTTGTCGNCHQIGDEGKNVGPALTEIGSKLSKQDLYVAILNPSAAISHNFETYTALTLEGVVVSGLLIGENDNDISIKSADAVVHTISRDDLDLLEKKDISLMPANLQQNLSQQDLVDLVDFLQMLKKGDESRFNAVTDAKPAETNRDPRVAIAGFEIADDIAVELFAYEPMMYSPTAIDIDHRGRVFVCEAVNYRHFRNPENEPRTAGDRILVMTDSDGDGEADRQTVFYQGSDIDSPHGVCVLGEFVIVSAGENVFVFRDTDGDDVADDKTILFTGIGGVNHDHGIHSFMPGPDGKLYFNFGNEGHQICDGEGNPIIDLAGNEINDSRDPYQQGMVFRCDVDGSNMETLGWNFRNNWEVAVDSFGAMWQSDNDDDGNRGTRINFVMEYGNYGYRDQKTGDYWNSERIGMEDTIPLQHWHLNDPGVVPNLLQTGAGSPTGMMIYEGNLLPRYRGQMIHTDPGPNIVRSYPTEIHGAGYTASIQNMIRGVDDQWFRPVDAVAAPDGSIIIADWYDPGVGGHRMGDIERGRLFRVTSPDRMRYEFELPKFDTVASALAALQSPNVETRFLAGVALKKFWATEKPDVQSLLSEMSDDAIQRARRMWVLSKVDSVAVDAIRVGLADSNVDIRLAAIRAARQCPAIDKAELIDRMIDDSSLQVSRELLVALRELDDPRADDLWVRLARKYDGSDRWYLEALGIAADNRWDTVFPAWLASVGDDWNTPAGRDIVWRTRNDAAIAYLVKLIESSETVAEQERYFRALDLLDSSATESALNELIAAIAS